MLFLAAGTRLLTSRPWSGFWQKNPRNCRSQPWGFFGSILNNFQFSKWQLIVGILVLPLCWFNPGLVCCPTSGSCSQLVGSNMLRNAAVNWDTRFCGPRADWWRGWWGSAVSSSLPPSVCRACWILLCTGETDVQNAPQVPLHDPCWSRHSCLQNQPKSFPYFWWRKFLRKTESHRHPLPWENRFFSYFPAILAGLGCVPPRAPQTMWRGLNATPHLQQHCNKVHY